MNVFIIGISGQIGDLLAQKLRAKGATVRGLVRQVDQQIRLSLRGIHTELGDLARLTATELASMLKDVDAIVFTAGSNGGDEETTRSIDRDGLATAIAAAKRSGVKRFTLVSVFPESWRERNLDAAVEYYFALKRKRTSRSAAAVWTGSSCVRPCWSTVHRRVQYPWDPLNCTARSPATTSRRPCSAYSTNPASAGRSSSSPPARPPFKSPSERTSVEGESMTVRLINPDPQVIVAFGHHVAVATGSRQVHIGGQVAWDPNGQLVAPGDLAGQVAQVYRNIASSLEAAGATFSDVVRITWYAAGWQPEMFDAFNAGVGQAAQEFDITTPPASLIGVQMLFQPEILIEAEVTAVLP